MCPRRLVIAALLCFGGATHATPAAPQAFALDPPGITPEPLQPGEAIPYLRLLPGMKVEDARLDETTAEEMSTPRTVAGFHVGPPVLRLAYAPAPIGPTKLRIHDALTTYQRALKNAGWTLTVGPTSTIARYARGGRDIWIKLQSSKGRLLLTLCDVGAQADATRLRTELERNGRVALYGIYFDFQKDVLRPESEATLLQVLKLLREDPALKLEIQGHSDRLVNNYYARRLSDLRAATIRKWLVEHGIDAGRLTHQGFEDSVPLMDNATPQGRSRNRRFELVKMP
jgi:OOP family OmpA-OmpF porin